MILKLEKSEQLKEKIVALDKRLEQARSLQQQEMYRDMMEVEDMWLK